MPSENPPPDPVTRAPGSRGPATPRRRRPAPAPAPSRGERLATVLRFPVGMVVISGRYLRHASAFRRSNRPGGPADLPPAIPDGWVEDDVKRLRDGHGPLFHREFTVRTTGGEATATELIDLLCADLDRAAPSEVVTFRKIRGEVGSLSVGDEYRVRIPAPWDGPVRVVRRDATSFRFVTLDGHLEAGQIEFRACDEADATVFTIETWSRAGNRVARLVFDRLWVGKEAQLNMWAQFCLAVPRLVRGRRVGPVGIVTRRWDDPVT